MKKERGKDAWLEGRNFGYWRKGRKEEERGKGIWKRVRLGRWERVEGRR